MREYSLYVNAPSCDGFSVSWSKMLFATCYLLLFASLYHWSYHAINKDLVKCALCAVIALQKFSVDSSEMFLFLPLSVICRAHHTHNTCIHGISVRKHGFQQQTLTDNWTTLTKCGPKNKNGTNIRLE